MTYNGQFTVTMGPSTTVQYPVTDQVINVSVKAGRQKITDRFTPNIATVELYAPATGGYTIPNLGDVVNIVSNGYVQFYFGKITDVQRVYDMPYNSGTGKAPGDRITITAESLAGYACGRGYATSVNIAASTTLKQAVDAVFDDGVSPSGVQVYFYGTAWDTFDAQNETYTGNVLDYINGAIISTQGYFIDHGQYADPYLYASGQRAKDNFINFTDAASPTNGLYTYDQIEFLAAVDNSYTLINVSYNSGAATVTATSGSAPYTSYTTTSILEDAADAQQVADVMRSILSQSAYRPYRISTRATMWPGVNGPGYYEAIYTILNTTVDIAFRGTTYNTILEGFTVNQDTEDARWTFYFSPALATPLVLDTTAWGILNTNTLGLG